MNEFPDCVAELHEFRCWLAQFTITIKCNKWHQWCATDDEGLYCSDDDPIAAMSHLLMAKHAAFLEKIYEGESSFDLRDQGTDYMNSLRGNDNPFYEEK